MTPDTITADGTTYVRAYPVAAGRCPCCGAGPRAWTPASVIARLRAEHVPPKAEHWLHEGAIDRPTFSTVRRMFGTWNRALEAAGYERRAMHGAVPYWTREQIIEAMIAWEKAHGGQPSYSDWARGVVEHPSNTTVRKVFGSWNKAIAEAGMVPRGSYGVTLKDRTPERAGRNMVDAEPVATAVRHYIGADGSALALSERMGVDPTPIHKLLAGKRARMEHRAADAILTAIGRTDVMAILEAA